MDTVCIAITSVLADGCHDLIQCLQPRIVFHDLSAWIAAEQAGDPTHGRQLDAELARTEIAFGHTMPSGLMDRAPALKWIQSTWTGIDMFLTPDIVQSPVIVTNMTGVHEVPIAESVLGFMLMFAKRAPACFEMKHERSWERFAPRTLAGQTLGIVGLGGVGREVARMAKAFGMQVIALRRTVSTEDRSPHVDLLLALEELPRLLKGSDYVALTLPYTAETAGMIGEHELRMMKPEACLINISRGDIVDEPQLIRALEAGWIAGAALDVFSTEPLPADSRLWDLPNVIFSPHVTGEVDDYDLCATKLFCDNLHRYLEGKPLRNVVDKQAGY